MAFPYVRAQADWKDANAATGGGDTSTPLTATALDTIEAGIDDLSNILENADAKGDLLVASAADAWTRLAIGAADTVLSASAGSAHAYRQIVNAMVDAAAAIAYSKLALTGSIVNADISSSAAIAISKIASLIAPTMLPSIIDEGASQALGQNFAWLTPIPNVVVPTTISRLSYIVTTSAGNIDIGIYYSDDESTFTRLFAQGAFASPGTQLRTTTLSSAQTITPVTGRRWYYAISTDSTTFAVRMTATAGTSGLVLGFNKATSHPLPASLSTMTSGVQAPTMVGQV